MLVSWVLLECLSWESWVLRLGFRLGGLGLSVPWRVCKAPLPRAYPWRPWLSKSQGEDWRAVFLFTVPKIKPGASHILGKSWTLQLIHIFKKVLGACDTQLSLRTTALWDSVLPSRSVKHSLIVHYSVYGRWWQHCNPYFRTQKRHVVVNILKRRAWIKLSCYVSFKCNPAMHWHCFLEPLPIFRLLGMKYCKENYEIRIKSLLQMWSTQNIN